VALSSPNGADVPLRTYSTNQLLCKTVCNQVINLAYYGSEKILLPLRFQHCGGERPCCPRSSNAFSLYSI